MSGFAEPTLIASILLRLSGVAISLVLLYRVRDYRFGFLTGMLSLMALRQVFTLFGLFPEFAELPGLMVSILAVTVVYYLLQYTHQENATQEKIRETNQELEESRNHLEATVAASPDDIFVFDGDSRYVDVLSNSGSEGPADLVGRNVEEVRPSPAAAMIDDAIEQTHRTGNPDRVEYELEIDDERRWFEGRTALLEESQENHVLFVRREVTRRKEHEQELRRFRRAVDAAGAAIYITDRDERITYVNPAFEEITGYTEADVIGETPRIISSGEHDTEYYEGLWVTILAGETWREEITNKRNSGEHYHAEQTIAPIFDESGEICEFVSIQIDVTERKHRERQLRVLDRILRHNLHNDMTVVLGHASNIEEATEGELARSARVIQEEGESLVAKVDKEREIVRLITESPKPRPIDMATLVGHRAADVRDRYEEATIDVDAPDTVTAMAVNDVERALEELLENAIVHCDRSPHVTIVVEAGPETVTLRIADNGPGIPAQERNVLAGNTDIDALYHGSGMGLWFVYWTVRLSEGTLDFEENDSRGSVVVLEFERQPAG
ncbi:PAS domain-containing sensor histidine kinase [Natrarchaeobaculum aegyptiacum]|uniref:histidine kinase n=1 Tax=Natrarchaeobaculum aegyptiacum TaxID=745377 RepID=A0A2Z2HWH8_9EURY|nr:PAS domain-containing sensor histidine kinase [Natrarchaeobaculum aegyptiacum]ARS91213.1 hypothetical protein B1756_16750 [Natrarchaeobaculum aegyptiacum]